MCVSSGRTRERVVLIFARSQGTLILTGLWCRKALVNPPFSSSHRALQNEHHHKYSHWSFCARIFKFEMGHPKVKALLVSESEMSPKKWKPSSNRATNIWPVRPHVVLEQFLGSCWNLRQKLRAPWCYMDHVGLKFQFSSNSVYIQNPLHRNLATLNFYYWISDIIRIK